VSDRQSQLDAIESQIAALPKPTKPVIAAGVATDEATRATAVASVLGGRLTWESVFSDLGRILPENVWLTNLTLTAPDGTAITAPPPPGGATTPTGVQMQGFTYSQPDVALLLARLATVPSLQRVTLTSSLQQPLGSRKVVHFVIVADLNQTGGAS
jgi:Tfp pilus assembly protein PilN